MGRFRAFVLVATDNPVEARTAVFAALNGASFDSSSPITDFALGFEHAVEVDESDYKEGEFLAQIPAARFLETANSVSLPI